MGDNRTYIQVILPTRFRDTVTYSVPEALVSEVTIGSRVEVMLGYKKYHGFVEEITGTPKYDKGKIRDILSVDKVISATPADIKFWRTIAEYYMCSSGEALKAATPFLMELLTKREKAAGLNAPGSETAKFQPEASESDGADTKTPTFVPEFLRTPQEDTRKADIYLDIIAKEAEAGKMTLILTPDIPSCRAMEKLLLPTLKERIVVYHSGQTTAKRREATKKILGLAIQPKSDKQKIQDNTGTDRMSSPKQENHPPVVIGLRSALFLPFRNLGQIIVDDEHDPLYKQSEPTPRYHGRDLAVILAQIKGAKVLLSSPTPSWETLHNVTIGKYRELGKYISDGQESKVSGEATLQVIDFTKEQRTGSTKGPITHLALAALRDASAQKKKCVIFRPKWAYPQAEEEWRPELEEIIKDIKVEICTDIHQIESLKTSAHLIVMLQGESLLSVKNFRAEERALQLVHALTSLAKDAVIIQTSIYRHNIFRLLTGKETLATLINEREEANLPPFTRMIHISVQEPDPEKLQAKGDEISKALQRTGVKDFDGPIPTSEEAILFQIRLPKEKGAQTIKRRISSALHYFENVIIDVDPQ